MDSELLLYVIHSGWGMGNKRRLILFELLLEWLCRCSLDEQVYESFFRIQTGAIVLVANVLIFSGAGFCRARAGLPWECGAVPAMGWALSRRWWQGDVSVSLLQGRGAFSLTGEEQWEPWQALLSCCLQGCSCRSPSVLLWSTAHHLLLLAMARVVAPWGMLPALPCKWRKDGSLLFSL